MLTYDLKEKDAPLYKNLYENIRNDIKRGVLRCGDKMPSKRTLARNLGVSVITVEKAYDQLIGEGYLYTLPQKGYYISNTVPLLAFPKNIPVPKMINRNPENDRVAFDFSSNMIESSCFPFSIWAKIIRETISLKERELMTNSPCNGVYDLRVAIAKHLSGFRGMSVDPDQIVVGAGTEYLYSLLTKLIGENKIYCIENPGYKKLKSIYELNHNVCRLVSLDDAGIKIEELRNSQADVAHISPTHHFPTGITMPVSRRYELLAWANEKEGRYIIEDDYDSEFRIKGNPIPTLQSIDTGGKVVYMNTFSKSLASTIRISYMVLPPELANLYYEKLSFLACTVPTFEQYTLAEFISQGYFEKHINRMRLYYGRKRKKVLSIMRSVFSEEQCRIVENDSGLHFLIELSTNVSDTEIIRRLKEQNIRISSVNDCDMQGEAGKSGTFIINYSNLNVDCLEDAVLALKNASMT
ncbi:MAG: PLP-dependent aminotransferase family protein [Acetatifactor sp.]